MRGTLQRMLRLSSGYGIGILTRKGEIFAISTDARADQNLVEAVRGFDLVKCIGSETGRVFYRPARNVEISIELSGCRPGKEKDVVFFSKVTAKQTQIPVNDPFDWEADEDFVPAEHDEIPPPA